MLRRYLVIVAAVVLVIGSTLLIGRCRDQAHERRGAAEVKVTDASAELQALRIQYATLEGSVARKDKALTEVLARPPRIVSKVIQVQGEDFVPRTDYEAVVGRLDSTRVLATAFRDTVRALRLVPPKIAATTDTVTKYQRVLIDTPKPRRRYGLGFYAGYGATANGPLNVSVGPQVGVGLTFSF